MQDKTITKNLITTTFTVLAVEPNGIRHEFSDRLLGNISDKQVICYAQTQVIGVPEGCRWKVIEKEVGCMKYTMNATEFIDRAHCEGKTQKGDF